MSVRRRTLIAAAAVVLLFLAAGLIVAFAEHRLVQLAAAAAGLGAAVGLAAVQYRSRRTAEPLDPPRRERQADYRMLLSQLGFWIRDRDPSHLDALHAKATVIAEPEVVDAIQNLRCRSREGEELRGEDLERLLAAMRREFDVEPLSEEELVWDDFLPRRGGGMG